MKSSLTLPAVYAITDRRVSGIDSHVEIARRLFGVGIRMLQVREKELPDGELLVAADAVGRLARESGATALINDRLDVARLAGLGVHLGEEDLPAAAPVISNSSKSAPATTIPAPPAS